MYFDRRLWAFTRGVRLRIAGTVLLGLLAVGAGIARLALFGWLLARVIEGDGPRAILSLLGLTAAAVIVRSALDHWRAMAAHKTAAVVQGVLRQAIYDRVTALGPAHFTRSRTGDVILSMVEGVQQLEVYFGQYLPQLAVAVLTPCSSSASWPSWTCPWLSSSSRRLSSPCSPPRSGIARTAARASSARRPTRPSARSSSTRYRA